VVRASLEAAFMELTADSVEYRAAGDEQGQPRQPAEGQPPAPELATQGQSAQAPYSHEGRI
jgi:hypothetical protein